MKAGNLSQQSANDYFTYIQKKYPHFTRRKIKKFSFFVPPLMNRSNCTSYNPEGGCLYCGNATFKYYSKAGGKKYYQCEKCWGINH